MATEILMPKLGLTMTEGTISEWIASDGDTIGRGDVLIMIETDKVEVGVESQGAGTLARVAAVGDTLEPGGLVGYLLADGEQAPASAAAAPAAPEAVEAAPATADAGTYAAPAAASSAPAAAPGGRVVASPKAKRLATELGLDIASIVGTGPDGRITAEDVEAAKPPSRGLAGRVLASPMAKRLARERGVDLAAVTGTGPDGRITTDDVSAAPVGGAPSAPAATPTTTPTTTAAAPAASTGEKLAPFAATKAAERLGIDVAAVVGSGPGGRVSRQDVYAHARAHGGGAPVRSAAVTESRVSPGDRIKMTGMRGIIAERMHTSLQEMAQLTLAMDVDMDRVVELRGQLKEVGAEELGAVPGFTDFVIAAVARALRDHPGANAQVEGNEVHAMEDVNVGMAVAVPNGLVVPVIPAADQLSLLDLAVETSRLANAARDGKLALGEMEGGTFSVTALGMFGVDMFTPVINPPNAGIMGVGRIRDDVAWEGDTPKKVARMTLSLTWDHRVLDGAPAAEFTQTVKRYLEQPVRLLG